MNLSVYVLAGIVFSVWMLIDAIRRKAEPYWFILLIIFPLPASVIYFFVVKLKDYRGPQQASSKSLNPHDVQHDEPRSLFGDRELDRADALEAREQYAEAIELYSQALSKDANNKRAMHGLARCYVGTNKPEKAQELLHRLLEMDREYRDYGAALDYAEALSAGGKQRDAVELLQGLVSVSPRINHRVALAHYAKLDNDVALAKEQLSTALDEYQQSSKANQLSKRRWAERCEKMLDELGTAYN